MSDRDFKDARKAAGYSLEELWFFRYNQELIAKLKAKVSRKREDRSDRSRLVLLQGGLAGLKESEAAPAPQAAPAPLKKAA